MGTKAWACVVAGTVILGCQPASDSEPAGQAAAASDQTTTWQDVQVADIEDMGSKFEQLAQAFDESQYAWQPMDSVRSVGFGLELERAGSLSKAAMIEELGVSFAFLVDVVGNMTEEERSSEGSYFGRPMPVHASIATAMADMHEHLGQLIAYARTNHVVPPWSAGN